MDTFPGLLEQYIPLMTSLHIISVSSTRCYHCQRQSSLNFSWRSLFDETGCELAFAFHRYICHCGVVVWDLCVRVSFEG